MPGNDLLGILVGRSPHACKSGQGQSNHEGFPTPSNLVPHPQPRSFLLVDNFRDHVTGSGRSSATRFMLKPIGCMKSARRISSG
jgi:hypothetical protein